MTDTIIKNTGNSRTLRMPPNALTMFPDWETFVRACSTDGAPIDLGPLNAAGLEQRGTDLVKATLLSNATETALWGRSDDRTVNAALGRLRDLITAAQDVAEGRMRITAGSYVGTGTVATATSPKSLSFPFPVKIFIFFAEGGAVIDGPRTERTSGIDNAYHPAILYVPALSTEFRPDGLPISAHISGSSVDFRFYTKRNAAGTRIYWYCARNAASYMYNGADTTYYYAAIG